MSGYVQTNQTILLPDTAYTVSAQDTGKIFLIDTVTAARTINLPPVSPGLHYVFINKAAGVLGGNIRITGGANSMYGLLLLGVGAGPVANAAINFITTISVKGDRLDIICDGVQWSSIATAAVNGAFTATA